jgi:Inner membrane component of T3SS, cytoplasmic domain
MPRLVIHAGTPQAKEYELKQGKNYIGRGFANDFQIEDGSVSTQHCQITVNGNQIHFQDLGSTNGSRLNGASVKEAMLQAGQRLGLGSVELLFHGDGAAVTSTVAASSSIVVQAAPMAVAAPTPPPGLRLSRGHASEAPAPAATTTSSSIAMAAPSTVPAVSGIVESPLDPAVMEAPAGMTTCKYHPKAPGQWLCQKCNLLFCSLCVTSRRVGSGNGQFCRKCGTQCIQVRVNYVPPKEKEIKNYSDSVILLRALGFGFGAAVLGAALWGGFAFLTGFDVTGLFCWAVGGLTGYGVKLGCQDRPGVVFSLIAVAFCLLGIVAGKLLAILGMGFFAIGGIFYLVFGMVGAIFTAWRIGGGDF